MTPSQTTALIIEDNQVEARLVQALLDAETGPNAPGFRFLVARRLAEALEVLRRDRPDLVLVDLSLPDCQGIEVLRRVLALAPDAAVVVHTSSDNRSLAVEALQAGAEDYLVKGEYDGFKLRRSLLHALERTRAARELRTLSSALNAVANAVAITDTRGTMTWINPAFCELTGYAPGELIGQRTSILKSGAHSEELYQDLWGTIEAGSVWRGEVTNRRKDGSLYQEYMTITPIRNEQGKTESYVAIKEDITEKRLLELKLRRSANLEALGRLAGGVAHDFNNMLMIILGYCEMFKAGQSGPERRWLGSIKQAGDQAAALVRQLLSFSRQALLQPVRVDLRGLLQRTQEMLRRVVREDIAFVVSLSETPAVVEVDPVHFQQVVVNLVVNAQDAMPEGGLVEITLLTVDLDPEQAPELSDLQPGPFVLLAVRDTGSGMSPETRERVFEPFFTTKPEGQGTGLGLASAHGFVRQSGGAIRVESAAGQGTTFELYFPRLGEEAPVQHASSGPVSRRAQATSTILLVEDEQLVRELIEETLANAGYEVVSCESAEHALARYRANDPPDLLLTDLIMPGKSGADLAGELLEKQPGLRILVMSGYAKENLQAKARALLDREAVAVLTKPFDSDDLLSSLERLLNPPRGRPPLGLAGP